MAELSEAAIRLLRHALVACIHAARTQESTGCWDGRVYIGIHEGNALTHVYRELMPLQEEVCPFLGIETRIPIDSRCIGHVREKAGEPSKIERCPREGIVREDGMFRCDEHEAERVEWEQKSSSNRPLKVLTEAPVPQCPPTPETLERIRQQSEAWHEHMKGVAAAMREPGEAVDGDKK